MSFENEVRVAQGYYELGMIAEAWEELESISAEYVEKPPVLQMRLLLLLHKEQWEEGLAVSRRLCEVDESGNMGYIHAAYCLHELGKTKEAKKLLLGGPNSLMREPVYFYNLGCYEVAMGELEEAERCLRQSFEMDRKLMEIARKDPDLECLWEVL